MRLLFAFLFALLAAPAAFAAAPECHGPFCPLEAKVDELAALDAPARLAEMRRVQAQFEDSRDELALMNVADAINRLEYALNRERDQAGLDEAAAWERDVRVQLLRISFAEPTRLGPYYHGVRDVALRTEFVRARRADIARVSDRDSLGRLIWLLFLYRAASEKVGDPTALIAETRAAELEASARLRQLFPPEPGSGGGNGGGSTDPGTDTSCGLPVCDVQKELDRYRGMSQGGRYTAVAGLQESLADVTDVRALEAVAALGRGLVKLFDELNEQSWTIGKAQGVLNDSLTALLKLEPVDARRMSDQWNELVGEAARYGGAVALRTRVAGLSDRKELEALAGAFDRVAMLSSAAHDPDYIAREARSGVDQVGDRVRELFPGQGGGTPTPPPVVVTPPVPDPQPTTPPQPTVAPVCLAPQTCPVDGELAKFRALGQGDRYSALTRLRAALEPVVDTKVLEHYSTLAERVRSLLVDLHEEDWLVREAEGLKNDANEALMKRADPDGRRLAQLYAGMRGESARFEILVFWRTRAAAYFDKLPLLELAEFFAQARASSDSEHDPEYVSREAAAGEQQVRDRIAEL